MTIPKKKELYTHFPGKMILGLNIQQFGEPNLGK